MGDSGFTPITEKLNPLPASCVTTTNPATQVLLCQLLFLTHAIIELPYLKFFNGSPYATAQFSYLLVFIFLSSAMTQSVFHSFLKPSPAYSITSCFFPFPRLVIGHTSLGTHVGLPLGAITLFAWKMSLPLPPLKGLVFFGILFYVFSPTHTLRVIKSKITACVLSPFWFLPLFNPCLGQVLRIKVCLPL